MLYTENIFFSFTNNLNLWSVLFPRPYISQGNVCPQNWARSSVLVLWQVANAGSVYSCRLVWGRPGTWPTSPPARRRGPASASHTPSLILIINFIYVIIKGNAKECGLRLPDIDLLSLIFSQISLNQCFSMFNIRSVVPPGPRGRWARPGRREARAWTPLQRRRWKTKQLPSDLRDWVAWWMGT